VPVSDDDKIVNLGDKLRAKAASVHLRGLLDKTIHQMRDYATRAEIARILRGAAADLEDDGEKPA
jgi:hypothetical protein